MEKVVLVGAGGHAKVVLDSLEQANTPVAGVFDSNLRESFLGYPYLGNNDDFMAAGITTFIIAIGNNKVRKNIAKETSPTKVNAIHPQSFVSPRAQLGVGNMIMANTTINAHCIIGNHCIINTNASVDHDCQLEDFVHISPQAGLGGNVKVGEGTHIGIGAQVIQNIKIGKWVTVGAGAVVINDIPDYAVVVGNPGKIIKYNS